MKPRWDATLLSDAEGAPIGYQKQNNAVAE
jgi:hypothetical protein